MCPRLGCGLRLCLRLGCLRCGLRLGLRPRCVTYGFSVCLCPRCLRYRLGLGLRPLYLRPPSVPSLSPGPRPSPSAPSLPPGPPLQPEVGSPVSAEADAVVGPPEPVAAPEKPFQEKHSFCDASLSACQRPIPPGFAVIVQAKRVKITTR